MDELSILIGGKAGFGIDKAGAVIGRLLNQLGYHIFIYRDYPSLIRGGHTFSIIRASIKRISAHYEKIDLIIALNQETLDLHRKKLKSDCLFLFDSDQLKFDQAQTCGLGISLGKILKEEAAPEVMRNTCIIGAMAKVIGIDFDILGNVLKKEFTKEIDLNIKVARRGFDEARELQKIDPARENNLPLVSGNEAVALGLIQGGLDAYISYPMTPSSPILHFLAGIAEDFSLDVIHPESEIAVILMALGYAYAGKRAAVGTSGGGFCLMTEGLSLAGMAELPITIVLGQRPGPSTGLPTYTAQTELHFALNAGQGEFVRFLVVPGDAEEAYYWSAIAMNLSWKHQIPAIILTDKHLGESVFNFDIAAAGNMKSENITVWDGKSPYKRYLITEDGISPLAFVPNKDNVIKANSYEHDESGITTEEPETARRMQEKRLRKDRSLTKDLEALTTVKIHGKKDSKTALLSWGSNKGVCVEVAEKFGLKVIQPIVMNPFPARKFREALDGIKRLISVENNATGQLMRLVRNYGFAVHDTVFKYDGRPFSCDELEEELGRILK